MSLEPPHGAPPWAPRIRRLLEEMGLTQAALADRIGVSASTVSRWMQGSLEPNAESYVSLGNLAGSPEGLYFWERAGMEPSAFPTGHIPLAASSLRVKLADLQLVTPSRLSRRVQSQEAAAVVIPLLNICAYSDRVPPHENVSLPDAQVEEVLMAPLAWCPNPDSILSMHVCGDSMEPLIHSGSILVVDTSVTDRDALRNRLSVFSHRDLGFKLARFERLQASDVLVSANHKYAPLDISEVKRWKPLGEVLWWVSKDAPPEASGRR